MNVSIVMQGVASVAWLIFFAGIALTISRASRGRNTRPGIVTTLVGLLLALLLTSVSAGLVFIQPAERGVVISAVSPKGYREQALDPGLRWIVPFLESVRTYSISRQTYTMSRTVLEGQVAGDDSIAARTADGQEIFIDASVIFSLDPTKVIQIHIDWQERYINDLVRPLARGILPGAVSPDGGGDGGEEVVTEKRLEMAEMIRFEMDIKMAENGLVLADFVLRNVTFSPEYAASVEQKQVAEQQAQQAKFVVETKRQEAEQVRQTAQGAADSVVIKAKGDAEARIIQAKAEAESLLLIAAAIQENPSILQYQYINKLAP